MNRTIRKATIIVSAAAGIIFIILGVWAMVTMLNYYSVMSEVVDDSAAATDKIKSVIDACGMQYGLGLLFLCISGMTFSMSGVQVPAASDESEDTGNPLERPQKKERPKKEKHHRRGLLRGKKQAVDEEKADEFQIPEEPENTQENEDMEPAEAQVVKKEPPQEDEADVIAEEEPEAGDKDEKIGKEELKEMLREALGTGSVTEEDIHAGNIVIVTKDGKRAMRRRNEAISPDVAEKESLKIRPADI